LRNRRRRLSAAELLEQEFPGQSFRGRLIPVEHHLAHLASCFHASPYERAVAVSVDGFGDFSSAAWGLGEGDTLQLDGRVYFPHSLGVFYQAVTQYLGFPNYGDEYKVMGLAPYGEAAYMNEMRRMVRLKGDGSFALDLRYFRHHSHAIGYEWSGGEPRVSDLYSPALVEMLGPARNSTEELEQRHKDIARSAQAMYEEALFHLLFSLHARYRVDKLTLAGGCAMNSVANGRVYANTPYTALYVQPAAGDAGGALGAAIVADQQLDGRAPRVAMTHAYWGPSASDGDVAAVLEARKAEIEADGCVILRHESDESLVEDTAAAIADGEVVGWYQGRMEWGPRALGNRSILCDPRRADMRELLNLKIKRRESFRPFAPSVLREAVADWFQTDDDVPFMMKVFQVRPERRETVPAITHVDGSGRLQTVTPETNRLYHDLIQAFERITDVPMILNTSFNENEPIVCRPEEALDCFLRTKMDRLALGRTVVRRPREAHS